MPSSASAPAEASPEPTLLSRPFDRFLVTCFGLFAITSLVFEMYIVFGVDLAACEDPVGRLWHFYAVRWDPIFLDPPLYLKIMCAIDGFVFGPFYLVAIYAFVKRANWIRIPALIYVSAIVYSTVVYFGVEFLGEGHRANLLMVLLINIPYTIVPLLLAWRVRRPEPFG